MPSEYNLYLTKPQREFYNSKAKYPAMVAGLGSGKTFAGVSRLVGKLLQNPKATGAYYMPSYDLLQLRAMPGVESLLMDMGLNYSVNKARYTITMPQSGNQIIFRSYDRPERIVAYEVSHSIVDELDTLPFEKARYVWRKVVERNREQVADENTIGLVTTPDQGTSGFVYSLWGNPKSNDYEVIKARTDSNPYVPSDYVDSIRANYDPVLAELYIAGEFVSLSRNKVYHLFNRSEHHTDRELKKEDGVIHVSIDFNVGGCCSTVGIVENIDGSSVCRIVGEFTSHDTRDFINNLFDRFSGRRIIVYPDASGKAQSTNASASDIDIISQAGFQVDAPNSNPFIRDRINTVNGMFAHHRLFINTLACPNLTKALESQGYNDKGIPEKFDDHPSIDDWTDSLGYYIYRMFPINRKMSTIKMGGIL